MRFYFLIGNYLETSETYLSVLFCIIEKDANFSAKIIEIFKFLLFPIGKIWHFTKEIPTRRLKQRAA